MIMGVFFHLGNSITLSLFVFPGAGVHLTFDQNLEKFVPKINGQRFVPKLTNETWGGIASGV